MKKSSESKDGTASPGSKSQVTWAEVERRLIGAAASPEDVADWAIVVDDEHESILMIGNILKSLCISVHPFVTAAAALEFMRGCNESELKKILAVFSEIETPEMSGFQLLRELRQDSRLKKVPFVTTSSYLEHDMIQSIAPEKICGMVKKPYKAEAIVGQILALKKEPEKQV